MSTTYGWRKIGARNIPLPPPYTTSYAHPILPEKVFSDYAQDCDGCPYPRHGLICRDREDGCCLRTDMRELEEKWREQRRRKRQAMIPCLA